MEETDEKLDTLVFQEVPSDNPDLPVQKPFYELNGDLIPLLFKVVRDGTPFHLEIAARQYSPNRLAQMLRDRQFVDRPAEDERGATDLDRPPLDIERDFFDEHFAHAHLIKRDGSHRELSKEQLIEIDAWSDIKAQFVNIGLNGIHTETSTEASDDLDLLLSPEPCIRNFTFLSNGSDEARVEMGHYYKPPSAEAAFRYRKAMKVRTGRSREQKVVVDYRALGELYRIVIRRVDGMLINGDPCAEDNREDWKKKVPLYIQIDVITQIFQKSDLKN